MDEGISLLVRKLVCLLARLVIDISVKHDFCAVTLGAVHLDKRSGGRHHDDCLAAVAFAAYATPCAWFPADAVISPFARSSSLNVLIL